MIMKRSELVSRLEAAPRFIALHSVELDRSGVVIDARLLSWNDSYERLRRYPLSEGLSMLETYVEGPSAVNCVRRAWEEGIAHQLVEHRGGASDVYCLDGSRMVFDVCWLRSGDHVAEVATELRLPGVSTPNGGLHSQGLCASPAEAKATVRREIGENLHDSIIQQLFASVLTLNAAASRTADEKQASTLQLVATTLSGAITELRGMISGLKAPVNGSVRDDLEEAVGFIVESAGVRLSIDVDDAHGQTVDREMMGTVRMVARELVSNSVRHGQASAVWVLIEFGTQTLTLTVHDDGVGLCRSGTAGNGLVNLRARALRLGGALELRQRPGGGTTAVWQVPLSVREDMA